jgi:hypothetical protein
MAISSYPRTIKNGQIAPNGSANSGIGLMLYNSSTGLYEAATPSTFGGVGAGGATAANQTTQITNFAIGTNSGVLTDIFFTQNLTNSFVGLPDEPCKTVTLINLSTNNNVFYRISNLTDLILEAGYSVKINTNNLQNLEVRQSTESGQSIQIIVTY